MKKILLALAILIAVAFLAGYRTNTFNMGKIFSRSADIGQEAAKAKVVDFVTQNMVKPGTKVEVKSASEESGLYKVVLTAGKQEGTMYISRDGSKFFPDFVDMAEAQKKMAEQNGAEANKEIPKTDKPQVDLYVMSFCPFGNKAEDTLAPVYALLKDKVNFNFHYIVSTNGDTVQSLHGDKEVTEDKKEACVLKEYGKDSWMDMVGYVNKNCGSDGSCWDAGAGVYKIDQNKINSCVGADGLDLMKANEKASKDAKASGSPTMVVNGVETEAVYKYGDSEAYKQAICGAFSSTPSECSQTLSSETSTNQGGSCGN